jgi:hypothetical protein
MYYLTNAEYPTNGEMLDAGNLRSLRKKSGNCAGRKRAAESGEKAKAARRGWILPLRWNLSILATHVTR